MARTTKKSSIATWDEAEAALGRIAEIRRQTTARENALNKRIDFLKARYKEEADPLLAELAVLEKDLKIFTTSHRADFAPAQSRRLTFGIVGFRKSAGLTVHNVKNTIAAIQKILSDKCEQFIRITEKLDKEALEELDADTLSSIGVTRRESEAFYYDVAKEELA